LSWTWVFDLGPIFRLTGSPEETVLAGAGFDSGAFFSGVGDRARFFSGVGLLFFNLDDLSSFLAGDFERDRDRARFFSGEGLLFFLKTFSSFLAGAGDFDLERDRDRARFFSGVGLRFLETLLSSSFLSGDAALAFFDAGVKSMSSESLSSSLTVSADFGRFLIPENSFVETFVGVNFFELFPKSSSSSLEGVFLDLGPGLADLGPANFADLGPGFELFGPGLESPDLTGEGFAFGKIFRFFGVPSEIDFFLTDADDAPPSDDLTSRTFLPWKQETFNIRFTLGYLLN